MYLKALSSLCHFCNEFKHDQVAVQLANVSLFLSFYRSAACRFICVCVCECECVCACVR
jgi:hypothetical protein